MNVSLFARLALVSGLVAGGAATAIGAPAQASEGWVQSNKVCKEHTAGTVCLEQRKSEKTGQRQSRMIITPKQGQWIRPDVHAVFGWDYGTERGACDLEGCEKVTKPMTAAWIRQGDAIHGLGYSTPHGKFDIYMGESRAKTIKSSGWKAEDPGRVAVQAVVKLKNNKTYYTGRLRIQSVDGVPIQPKSVKVELLSKGKVSASSTTTWTARNDDTSFTGDATKAISMPSSGFGEIRVTGTYETPAGKKGSLTTSYRYGR